MLLTNYATQKDCYCPSGSAQSLHFLLHRSRGPDEALLDHLGMVNNPFEDGQLLVPIHKAHETMDFISKELAEPYLGARIGQSWAETQGPPFERAKENVTSLSQLFVKLTQIFQTKASTGSLGFSVTSTHAELLGKRSSTGSGGSAWVRSDGCVRFDVDQKCGGRNLERGFGAGTNPEPRMRAFLAGSPFKCLCVLPRRLLIQVSRGMV